MQGKKVGVGRFTGKGLNKFDPKPGTVAWYKANLPDRFNNTMINIRSALFQAPTKEQQAIADRMAAQVLAWNEKPLAGVIASGSLDLRSRCPGCGFDLKHTDKPFPRWDKKA